MSNFTRNVVENLSKQVILDSVHSKEKSHSPYQLRLQVPDMTEPQRFEDPHRSCIFSKSHKDLKISMVHMTSLENSLILKFQ
jgi:hypothetical protein